MIWLSGMLIWYVSELLADVNQRCRFGMNMQDVSYILTQVFHSAWTVCIAKCNWGIYSAWSNLTRHNTQHKSWVTNSLVLLKVVLSWLNFLCGHTVLVNPKFAIDEWFEALCWHKCHGWSMPYYSWHKVSWELESVATDCMDYQYIEQYRIHFQWRLYQLISVSK